MRRVREFPRSTSSPIGRTAGNVHLSLYVNCIAVLLDIDQAVRPFSLAAGRPPTFRLLLSCHSGGNLLDISSLLKISAKV